MLLSHFHQRPRGEKTPTSAKKEKKKNFCDGMTDQFRMFLIADYGNNWGHRRITGVVWEDRGAVA